MAMRIAISVLMVLATSHAEVLFTVHCQQLTVQRSDPIVMPGVASGHVHNVVGGTAFSRNESAADAVNSAATTCDKMLDHSNYWVPALYHENRNGTYSLVPVDADAMVVYYLRSSCDYKPGRYTCNDSEVSTWSRAPPAGLKMLAGNPSLRTYNATDPRQRAISHTCLGPPSGSDVVDAAGLPNTTCNRILRSQVLFPSCWDGVNLDSPDHQSHMSYPMSFPYGNVCPASHPFAIYLLFYEFFYQTWSSYFPDFNRWVYANGDATGYGFHGDFINGWTQQAALERVFPTCTDYNNTFDSPGCSLRVNGQVGYRSAQVLQVPPPVEEVGFHGPLAALPGNNPTSGSPPKRFQRTSNISAIVDDEPLWREIDTDREQMGSKPSMVAKLRRLVSVKRGMYARENGLRTVKRRPE